MTKINRRNAKEIRDGILDARRGTERPWDNQLQKQGLYWEAHQRTVRKIVRLHEPKYLQEKRLAFELERIDDSICDLYIGQYGLLKNVPEEQREYIQSYLDSVLEDFREIRDHYGLEYK